MDKLSNLCKASLLKEEEAFYIRKKTRGVFMNEVLKRNNVKVIGNKEKVIMFAHGFGCDQTMWRHIVPSFEEEYQIVLFDYVGSGDSNLEVYNSEKYGSLKGYVQDVLDIIEALKLHEVIFVGHSVSSMIGMLAAIQKPEAFKSLVMIGPSPRYLNDREYFGGFEERDIYEMLDMMEMNFIGWSSYMAPIVAANDVHPAVAKEVEKSFSSTDPKITKQFAEVTFFSDHRKDLEKSSIPTLIIQCSEDSIVPIQVGEYLHRHIEKSDFKIMDVKGHYPHLSHPHETIQLIKEYLYQMQ